jgi:nitroreductase
MTAITKPVPTGKAETVEDAIATRHSIRAYLPDSVSKESVAEIVDLSARAPSGTNMQPWQVYVLAGAAKEALSRDILAAHDAQHEPGGEGHAAEVRYYPREFFEPYLGRRRKIGWDLYGLLGIEKGEKEKMHAQHGRNYSFFGAPVGMIFTIHRDLETGSWLDYGMFLQNVMLAARGRGLHTCPQAAFTQYHKIIRRHLPLTDDEVVVCGMSMGYADPAAIENTLYTEREPVETYTKFVGF